MRVLRRLRERIEREETAELVEETRQVLDNADASTAEWRAAATQGKAAAGLEVSRQFIIRQRAQSGEEFIVSDLFPDNPRGAQ